MEGEELYQATILDRARKPRNQGDLDPFDAEVQEVNALCGDRVTLRLRRDGAGRIAAIGYRARACALCIAAADLMAEAVAGLAAEEVAPLPEILDRSLRDGTLPVAPLAGMAVFGALRDTPSRIGCVVLPWRALGKAIRA